ncbi:MAG: tandem-95 repeat protein, partial [Planctomycetota bacterium]|nr:tandem-95 repeat protein [Planctomycetota bacterium]
AITPAPSPQANMMLHLVTSGLAVQNNDLSTLSATFRYSLGSGLIKPVILPAGDLDSNGSDDFVVLHQGQTGLLHSTVIYGNGPHVPARPLVPLGDINNDGFGDLAQLVAEPSDLLSEDGSQLEHPTIQLFYGKNGSFNQTPLTPSVIIEPSRTVFDTVFNLQNIQNEVLSFADFASLGDVNNDGLADFGVADRFGSRSHVFFGKPVNTVVSNGNTTGDDKLPIDPFRVELATPIQSPTIVRPGIDLHDAGQQDIREAFRLEGTTPEAFLSNSQMVGDFNGDRYDDLLVWGQETAYLLLGPVKLDSIDDITERAEMIIDLSGGWTPAEGFGAIDGNDRSDLVFVSTHGGQGNLDVRVIHGSYDPLRHVSVAAEGELIISAFGLGPDGKVSLLNWDDDGFTDLLAYSTTPGFSLLYGAIYSGCRITDGDLCNQSDITLPADLFSDPIVKLSRGSVLQADVQAEDAELQAAKDKLFPDAVAFFPPPEADLLAAAVVDLNADGVDEVVFARPNWGILQSSAGGVPLGRVYVINNSLPADSLATYYLSATAQGHVPALLQDLWIDNAVHAVGDLNRDAKEDIALIRRLEGGGFADGSVQILYGEASMLPTSSSFPKPPLNLSAASINIHRVPASELPKGLAIRGPIDVASGDFDNDGRMDLATSQFASETRNSGGELLNLQTRGRVDVLWSIAELASPVILSDTAANLIGDERAEHVTIHAARDLDGFSFLPANRMDINRDGFDDLLIGAPAADVLSTTVLDQAGAIYALLGTPRRLMLPADKDVVELANETFTGIGDVLTDQGKGRPEVFSNDPNGDGVPDTNKFTLAGPNSPPQEEAWYRFTIVGDGKAGNVLRVVKPAYDDRVITLDGPAGYEDPIIGIETNPTSVLVGGRDERDAVLEFDLSGLLEAFEDINAVESVSLSLPGLISREEFTDSYELVIAGGLGLFVANTPQHGFELWSTDGTAAGTAMVKDIEPGPTGGNPFGLTPIGNLVFFSVSAGDGANLWVSDGTAAGTYEIAVGGIVNLHAFTEFDGRLFFAATDGSGDTHLYATTGSGANITIEQVSQNQFAQKSIDGMKAAGDTLFIAVYDSSGPGTWNLWSTTAANPSTGLLFALAYEDAPSSADDLLQHAVAIQDGPEDVLVFVASEFNASTPGFSGTELWRSNGRPGQTHTFRITDLSPGDDSSNPRALAVHNNVVHFLAFDDPNTSLLRLWQYDPSQAIPVSSPLNFAIPTINFEPTTDGVFAGEQYFFSVQDSQGTTLYAHDAGMVLDVAMASGGPLDQLTVVGDRVAFQLRIQPQDPSELWITDGTDRGTEPIFTGGLTVPVSGLQVLGQGLLFLSEGKPHSSDLWTTNLTTAESLPVLDVGAVPGELDVYVLDDAGDGVVSLSDFAAKAGLANTISIHTDPVQQTITIDLTAAIKGSEVFTTASNMQIEADLNNAMIHADLSQAFADEEIALAPTATAKVLAFGVRWQIDDGNRRYFVEKNNGQLVVSVRGVLEQFDRNVTLRLTSRGLNGVEPLLLDLNLPDSTQDAGLQVTRRHGVRADLLNEKGGVLDESLAALDMRNLKAGTYYLRVFNPHRDEQTTNLDFAIEIKPPIQGQVHPLTDNDVIFGNEGEDILVGDDHLDRLFGQSGDDVFVGEAVEIRDLDDDEAVRAPRAAERIASDSLEIIDPLVQVFSIGAEVPGPIKGIVGLFDTTLARVLAADLNVPLLETAKGPRFALPVHVTDLASLWYLDASSERREDMGGLVPVRDLTGLEYAANLFSVNLAHNTIADISMLDPGRDDAGSATGLELMRYLSLDDNPLHDISPLGELRQLRVLTVNDTWNYAQLGLFGEYFLPADGATFPTMPDFNLRTPDFGQAEGPIDFDNFGNGTFNNDSRLGGSFAAQWTGQIFIAAGGRFEFSTNSNDGSCLFIDGQTIVDNGCRTPDTSANGVVELSPGYHDIRLDYFSAGNLTADVDLKYKPALFGGVIPENVPVTLLTTGGVRDAASIAKNNKLVYLSLANNSIGDPNGLGVLDDLVFLDLSRNEISGIAGLSGIYLIDDGDLLGGYSETGQGWSHNTQTVASATNGDYRFQFDATADDKAQWSFTDLPDGEYEVYATWHKHHDHATDATYEIKHAKATDKVAVNQRFDPDSLTLGGQVWEKLGTFTPVKGELLVSLLGEGDGTVVADAVMLRAVDSILPSLTKLNLSQNPLDNQAHVLDIPEILPTHVVYDADAAPVWTSNLVPQVPTAVTVYGNELFVPSIAQRLTDPNGNYVYHVFTNDPLVTGVVHNGTLRVLAVPTFEGVAQITVVAATGPHYTHDSRGRSAAMTFDYIVGEHFLRGRKFADQNQNGVQDAGERGLENWTIFLDYDQDGIREQGMTSNQFSTNAEHIDAGVNKFEINVTNLPSVVTGLQVSIDITHPDFKDLQNLTLISPNNTEIELFSEVNYSTGAGGPGGTLVVTFDEAGAGYLSQFDPANGTYRPDDSFETLFGDSGNGLWRLQVDNMGTLDGSLNNWTLTLLSDERFVRTDANGDYFLADAPLGAGAYVAEEQQPQAQAVPLASVNGITLLDADFADPSGSTADADGFNVAVPSSPFATEWQVLDLDNPPIPILLNSCPFPPTGGLNTHPFVLWFGLEEACNYDLATPIAGATVSNMFDLRAMAKAELTLNYFLETNGPPDLAAVEVWDGSQFVTVADNANVGGLNDIGQWQMATIDLTPFTGLETQLRFRFDSGDDGAGNLNPFTGWMIDDVHVEASPTADFANLVAIEVSSDQQVAEGTTVTVTNVVHPSINVGSFGWQPSANVSNIGAVTTTSFQFTPTKEGTYTLTAIVNPGQSNEVSDSAQIFVSDVKPTIEAGQNATGVKEGEAFTRSLSIVDPGDDSWKVVVDYGDGTTSTVTQTSRNVALNRTFVGKGTYTVKVTVTGINADNSVEGSATDSFTVAVVANPPVINFNNSNGGGNSNGPSAPSAPESGGGGGNMVAEGSTYSTMLTITDPTGQLDAALLSSWTFNVNWGDGAAESFTPAVPTPGTATATLNHVYADEGDYTVTITVVDDDGDVATGTETASIMNASPMITSAAGPGSLLEGQAGFFSAAATDPGADTRTFTWSFGDGHGATGAAVTHTYADNGSYTATVTVSDGDGGSAAQTMSVTVDNVAPVLTPAGAQQVAEGQTLSITDIATFVDSGFADATLGNTKSFTYLIDWADGDIDSGAATIDVNGAAGLPTIGSFNGSHTYADNGVYTVSVTITDDNGGSDSETVTVIVNNIAPTVTATASPSVNEASSLSLTPLVTFTDPGFADGDLSSSERFTYSINWGDGSPAETGNATIDTGGMAGVLTAGHVDGSHTYADNGVYTITVTVTDDDGGKRTATLPVTVANVAPVITLPATHNVDEDAFTTISGSFNDPGADQWTVSADFAGNGTFVAVPMLGKSFTLAHVYNTPGTYLLAVKVLDDDGGQATKTVTVTVNDIVEPETPFVALLIAPLTVSEDAAAIKGYADLNVVFDDPDHADSALTFSIVNNSNASLVTITLQADDTLDLSFASNQSGSAQIELQASDPDGHKVTHIFPITVNAVNDPPTADGQSVSTNEDTAKAITLTGSDVEGASLSFIIVSGPTHGSLSGTAPNLTYMPNADFNGMDSFTFKSNDGTADSALAAITLTVISVNDVPTADNQTVTTDEDVAKPFTLTGSDADGDSLTFVVVSQPTNGSLSGTAPNLTYTPNANYHGSDSFTFKTNDGTVDSALATINLTVTSVNDLPTADNQSISTNEDTAKAITLTGGDIDGDPLTFIVVSPPANGSLSGTAPNLTYTPNANHHGPDSFTFKSNDGTADSALAAITLTVTSVNDVPTADNQTVTTDEDVAKPFTLTGSDADGDSFTFMVVSQPTNGTLSGTAPNLTYTPNANYHGSDSFTFKTNDGNVDSELATVAWTITSVNDAPSSITLDNATVDENAIGAVIGNVTVSDVDASDSHTVVVSDERFEVVSGQLRLKNGESLNHETEPSVMFDLTATDDGSPPRSLTKSVTITVLEISVTNEAPTDIGLSNASVAEDAVGGTIGVVSVTDPDAGDTHTLSVSDNRFEVVNGELRLKSAQSLDYESTPTVSLTITATDSGSPALSLTKPFTITVV